MKKIKLLIIPVLLLLLCGCVKVEDTSTKNDDSELFTYFNVYTDNYTCVEYFVSDDGYYGKNVSPRYNQDGTLKTNERCLNERTS